MSDSDEDEPICPLCIQPLDATDRAINYCVCGYQMCLWCWHQLMETAAKDNTAGRCPNCRTIYDKQKIEMHAITPELLEEERRKKKEEKKKGARSVPKGKQDLAHIRVVQRNLVYAVGLPLHICREETLAERQYFGQFGKTKKISVNRSGIFAQGQGKSVATGSAYVTFTRNEDAVRCIEAIDGSVWDGKPIRACFGTTKYCNAFLKGVVCNNPDCLYLHDIANEDDSFNKDDMNNGTLSKHIMQLVHPLAGDRSKGVSLGKAPAPIPQPFATNGGAAGETSCMTQLGKGQAGSSHVNPWNTHQLHMQAAELPASPVRGVQKPPPGPNLAEQEWPSLGAAADEPDRSGAAEGDVKLPGTSATPLSRTSSLTGDLTVADAVKAAIAAATATKPTAKQQAAGKPAATTITLTKPTKARTTATAVAAAKAKVQLQAPPQTPASTSEPLSFTVPTATAAIAPPPAAGGTAAPATPLTTAPSESRDSRVAAAVEAALQPPSPSPSYQQAAVSSIATKPHKAAVANGKPNINAAGPQTGTEGTPAAASVAGYVGGSTPATEEKPGKPSKKTAATWQLPAAVPAKEPPAAQPQPSTDAFLLSATTSVTEAHPLSHTSSISSEVSGSPTRSALSATASAPATPEAASSAQAGILTASAAVVGASTATPDVSQPSGIGLISSSDPSVSPPSLPVIASNTSSASLTNWLSSEIMPPSVAVSPSPIISVMAGPSLDPLMDRAVQPHFLVKPAVPPGFDVPLQGSTLLKPPTAISLRGPPPGFSQPWQPAGLPAAGLPAVGPVAMPAPEPAPAPTTGPSSFDMNTFFTAPAPEVDPVAEPAGRGRKQSRFRFAQNGSSVGPDLDSATISDFSLAGLPGIDEDATQQAAGELNLFRKLFPSAKVNIVPGSAMPQPPMIAASTSDLPSSIGFPAPPPHEPLSNGMHQSGGPSNPGLALLQQLQRAARAEPPTMPAHPAPAHPPGAHTPGALPQQIPHVPHAANPYAQPPQASQPLASFLDPAIVNVGTAAAEMGSSSPTQQPAWPPGFASVAMQYAPSPTNMQLPHPSSSQPLYGAQQHSSMLGDASMYGFMRQGGLGQQPPYAPQNIPAVRAQQRGPPPGFNTTNTSYPPSYSDYGNAFNLMQARPPPPASTHIYGVGDPYQAGTNLMPSGPDVSKGYLFPTRI